MKKPLPPHVVNKLLKFGSASDPQPQSVETTFGKYRLLHEVGRGAMGVVYEAEDTELRRRVAIKILGSAVEMSDVGRRRFQREAQAAASLSHPNVVTVYDAGEHDGRMYLVMELIDGRSLDAVLEDKPPIPFIAALLEKVARAVGAVHSKGVIHRDIKPGNILVTKAGEPKVTDFGLAHWVQPDMEMTKAGAAIGTPLYMAPEQARGDQRNITVRTDVYALGAILYEALTGKPPFTGANVPEIYGKICNSDPVPPRRTNPRIPSDIEAICLKAIDKEPGRRYFSAGAFADDLRCHIDGLPVQARQSRFATTMVRRIRRKPLVWSLGGVALVAFLFMTALAFKLSGRSGELVKTEEKLRDTTREARLANAYTDVMNTLPLMQKLEDHWYGEKHKDVAGSLDLIRKITAETSKKYPEIQLPDAWRGLALVYGGFAAEGMETLKTACAKSEWDPFPHVMLARAHLSIYAREIGFPRLDVSTSTLVLPTFKESAKMVEAREAAGAAMDKAAAVKIWDRLSRGSEYRNYALGMSLFGHEKYSEALEALEALRFDPALKDETGMVRGLAMFLKGRHLGAVEVWSEVAASRGWMQALYYSAIGRIASASLVAENWADRAKSLEPAIVDLGRVIEKAPDNLQFLEVRAYCYVHLSTTEILLNRPGKPLLDRAIEDYDRLIGLAQGIQKGQYLSRKAMAIFTVAGAMRAFSQDSLQLFEDALGNAREAVRQGNSTLESVQIRSLIALTLGQAEQDAGKSGESALQQAVDDLTVVINAAPQHLGSYMNRGNAWSGLARAHAGSNRNPVPLMKRALEDYDEVLRRTEDLGIRNPTLSSRAGIYLEIAEFDIQQGRDPHASLEAALRDYTEAHQGDPTGWLYLANRGNAYQRLAAIDHLQGLGVTETLKKALADFSKALEVQPTMARLRWFRSRVYLHLNQVEGARGLDTLNLALGDMQEYVKLLPAHAEGWIELGRLHASMKHLDPARAAFEKAYEITKDPKILGMIEGLKKSE